MDIEGREESSNVEDRRGSGGKTGLVVGGAGGIVIVVLGLIFGFDPSRFVGNGNQNDGAPRKVIPNEEELAHFAKVVFRDTEVVWDKQFKLMNRQYEKPTLVLFSGKVDSACGRADASVGPFYCPGDSKVYIDLAFYHDLETKLEAPGEFARAYVIAHEVGHHVQRLLGYSKIAAEREKTMRPEDRHEMSVRLELQADYLAGVWAYYGQKEFKFLQKGDIDSAFNAAKQIGDDRLQKKATGHVVPETFSHGKSEQRKRWFQAGFETGSVPGAKQLFDLKYGDL